MLQGFVTMALFVLPVGAWGWGLGHRGANGPRLGVCGMPPRVVRTLVLWMMVVGIASLAGSLWACVAGLPELHDGLLAGGLGAEAVLFLGWLGALRWRVWAEPDGLAWPTALGHRHIAWDQVELVQEAVGPLGLPGLGLWLRDGRTLWCPGAVAAGAVPVPGAMTAEAVPVSGEPGAQSGD